MRILKLLNKKIFSIIFVSLFCLLAHADDKPVDIWNIDQNKVDQDPTENQSNINESLKDKENTVTDIFKMQSQKNNNSIKLDTNLETQEIKIFGLYDPDDYGLDINMWTNSDGDQLKNIFNKLDKKNLSSDASEIMQISLLTNAYLPKKKYFRKRIFKV